MAAMEKKLAEDEVAGPQETEVKSGAVDASKRGRGPAQGQKSKLKTQTIGKCERCGYISSQKICKACALLEGLNRNRPKTAIEVGVEDEESSTTLMRQMERLNAG